MSKPNVIPFYEIDSVSYNEITPEFLKKNYLFGIPLEDIKGEKMPDSLLTHYINAAIQYTQRMLQITIVPVKVENEIHDFYASDYGSWSFMQLHKRPIVEVCELALYYGERRVMKIPDEWIRHPDISGQIQLFPVAGTSGSIAIGRDGGLMPLTISRFQNAPSLWKVTYVAGLEKIPADMLEYICKRACIGILQIWGDLIIGAGIANQTISIDGLSQSIGTTQSPEFAGAGARIKSYSEDMKELEKALRDTYLGINLTVV